MTDDLKPEHYPISPEIPNKPLLCLEPVIECLEPEETRKISRYKLHTRWASVKYNTSIEYRFIILNTPEIISKKAERILKKLKPEKKPAQSQIQINGTNLECKLLVISSNISIPIETLCPGSRINDHNIENKNLENLEQYTRGYIEAQQIKPKKMGFSSYLIS